MHHTIRGSLAGDLCDGFSEPLAGMRVRLYRVHPRGPHQQGFSVLTDMSIRVKAKRLLAESVSDSQGRFIFRLDSSTDYDGDGVEIDVCCQSVPHQRNSGKTDFAPVHFTVSTIYPTWRSTDDDRSATWDCRIPAWFWCAIRARFNARVICGRVASRKTGHPMPDVRVRVDVPSQHPNGQLGVAVTDPNGRFRVDFPGDNPPALLPTWMDDDVMAGQEFSFHVETAAGTQLLSDPKDGERVVNRNQGNACLRVDLLPEMENSEPATPPVRSVMHLTGHRDAKTEPSIRYLTDALSPALLSLSFP